MLVLFPKTVTHANFYVRQQVVLSAS